MGINKNITTTQTTNNMKYSTQVILATTLATSNALRAPQRPQANLALAQVQAQWGFLSDIANAFKDAGDAIEKGVNVAVKETGKGLDIAVKETAKGLTTAVNETGNFFTGDFVDFWRPVGDAKAWEALGKMTLKELGSPEM